MKRTITLKRQKGLQFSKLLIASIFLLISSFGISQCDPPNAVAHLDINNVDAIIRNGEGLWTDGSSSGHEVPNGSGIHSIYAGNFWIGGLTPDQQLKFAGGRYNTNGTDFYPGPISIGTAETSEENCAEYNQLYQICEQDVLEHLNYFESLNNGTVDDEFPNGYTTPDWLFNYPAHGNTADGEALYLAPFFDYDQDGYYDPTAGDYPLFASMIEDNSGCQSCDALDGHKAIFWIDNDKGGVHTETQGEPIGLEIHNTAYAFSSNNFLDNTTFYKKKIINRGSQTLSDVYTGIWVDVDLGNSTDDYIGCDIDRNLGYCYNGDAFDDQTPGSIGYGENPPAVGIRLLHSPMMDEDGIDNDEDGIIDNEQIGMSGFMYYNNSNSPVTGSPSNTIEYYNYVRGLWRNGENLTFGGTGVGGTEETNYAFGGNTYTNTEEEWSEVSEMNAPGDRRFLMTSGPFTLEPNDEICIIYAVTMAFPNDGEDAVEQLKLTSDSIQTFYDNCSACTPPQASINQSSNGLEYEFNTYTTAENYEWTFGDGNTSDEQNPSHEYMTEGEYEVCLTTANECGSDTQCIIVSASPLGVRENDTDNVDMTWNQSQSLLNISSKIGGTLVVEVYDISGRVVINEKLNSQMSIKLSSLKAAMYVVKVMSRDGESLKVERIVKS